jgi:hypothetical protein
VQEANISIDMEGRFLRVFLVRRGRRELMYSGEPLPSQEPSGALPSFNSSAFVDGNDSVNKYETRLPMSLDVEAALTYVGMVFSGILFLILETKNDYVRFHAW